MNKFQEIHFKIHYLNMIFLSKNFKIQYFISFQFKLNEWPLTRLFLFQFNLFNRLDLSVQNESNRRVKSDKLALASALKCKPV